MLEQNFTCWYEAQDESSGKDILAPNLAVAARMAVDIWRHENIKELSGSPCIVYLRDETGKVSKVKVNVSDNSSQENRAQ
jgi:hypothetical protein